MLVEEYGLKWEIDDDPKKGQLGLLRENHYRQLFADGQRDQSFRPEDHWLDIGANIGAFAVRAAMLGSQILAFEPESSCAAQLEKNCELNNTPLVVIARSAVVGRERGEVDLAISNSFSSTHRIGHIRGRSSIKVPAVNIDDTVNHFQINKIKMDCEGSEAEILETMNFSPIKEIVFEYHFAFLGDHNWDRFYAILHRMSAAGFVFRKQPAAQSKTWHTIVWAVKP